MSVVMVHPCMYNVWLYIYIYPCMCMCMYIHVGWCIYVKFDFICVVLWGMCTGIQFRVKAAAWFDCVVGNVYGDTV